MSELYSNLKAALDGIEIARLKRCDAQLRGEISCDRFFLAKRIDSNFCTPKPAALMRSKKWLDEQKKSKERVRKVRRP
jgi:hypothetical protein